MDSEIKLTLKPEEEAKKAEELAKAAEQEASALYNYSDTLAEEANLTPEEKKQVEEFAGKIDISDSETLMQYGAESQKKIADFSDAALEKIKAKDMGEVGAMLTNLVAELKDTPTETKGFLGLFKKAIPADKLVARFSSVEKNVDSVAGSLTDHRNGLIRDISMFDELYETNLKSYKEITMYILAGKKAIEDARNGKLKELQEKASASGKAEDAQAASDYNDLITRFEKKIYDLELTRTVNMQMAPQIRMIQNNDVIMSEKIQSTLINTIPLWKNQMVIALGLANSKEALKAERAVNDLTNDLLKKNAESLQQGTVEIAKENERGIIDVETLTETNQRLIDTLKEVTEIQKDGREKRIEAEKELARIEDELKDRLLSLSGAQEEKES